MSDVSIVILNYNGKPFLEEFLPSLVKYSIPHQLIVADNCSTDNSVSYLNSYFPNVTLIQLSRNHGYAGGYNEALEQIKSKYFILINSDVQVTENWVNPLVEIMESDSKIAIVQPKILSYHERAFFEYAGAAGGMIDWLGYPYCRGRILNHLEKDNGQYDDKKAIFWGSGACFLIRSEVFFEVGTFDKDFFAHMEEIDLCWRIHMKGYQVMFCPDSKVYHVGGGTLAKTNPKKTYLNFRNGLSLLFKNLPGVQLLYKLPLRVFLDIAASIVFLFNGQPKHTLAVISAQIHFWKKLRNNLKKRKEIACYRSYPKNLIYKGLIPVDYFLLRKTKYSDLSKTQ